MQQKVRLKSIAVKEQVYLKLKTLGKFGQSYSDLIEELLNRSLGGKYQKTEKAEVTNAELDLSFRGLSGIKKT